MIIFIPARVVANFVGSLETMKDSTTSLWLQGLDLASRRGMRSR
jgi:hypothetical protein